MAYREDLAYIHDAGFTGSGPLDILRRHGVTAGLVVDLGCGSGRWAFELNRAGYDVLGVDQSPAFIRMARRIAPLSRFRTGSLWTAKLPGCDAVTAIGECLNYAPPADPAPFFARVYAALRPGGIFVFDVAGPSRIPPGGPRRHWTEGRDWAVLVESTGDHRRNTLTRRIVSFRKVEGRYRRSQEIHHLKLYRPADLKQALHRAGFQAEVVTAYGRVRLREGIAGLVARKHRLT